MDVINNVYENIDVYRCLVIYNNASLERKNQLYEELVKHDYPVREIDASLGNSKDEEDINKYRIYLVHHDVYPRLDDFCDVKTVNVIFCMEEAIYSRVMECPPQNDNMLLLLLPPDPTII